MKILRLKDVQLKTGLSKDTILEWEQFGNFPRRFKLGPRAMGWLESEIDEWIAERAASREDIDDNSDAE